MDTSTYIARVLFVGYNRNSRECIDCWNKFDFFSIELMPIAAMDIGEIDQSSIYSNSFRHVFLK